MNARESGLRRIRIATRGLAAVGVVGSIAFAGLARAATETQTTTPAPQPATTTSTKPGTKPGTRPPAKPPTRPHTDPAPAPTDDPPFVISGGS